MFREVDVRIDAKLLAPRAAYASPVPKPEVPANHLLGNQNSYSTCILKVLSGVASVMPTNQAALYLTAA